MDSMCFDADIEVLTQLWYLWDVFSLLRTERHVLLPGFL